MLRMLYACTLRCGFEINAVFFDDLELCDHAFVQTRAVHKHHNGIGAGEGNRTLVCSLGSCRSTIELRPRNQELGKAENPHSSQFISGSRRRGNHVQGWLSTIPTIRSNLLVVRDAVELAAEHGTDCRPNPPSPPVSQIAGHPIHDLGDRDERITERRTRRSGNTLARAAYQPKPSRRSQPGAAAFF